MMPNRTRIQFVHSLQPARNYQDRHEFEDVCSWWRAEQVGLCALIGLGGSGKTALADRFLRTLPGIMPATAGPPKDQTLTTPEGLFVYSFYSSASPESFFARLAAWLRREPYKATAPPPSYHETLDLLWDAPCLLLVLDGFERVQADGTRGDPVGLIQDGSLRDFLLRTANGEFRNLAVLITTRFRLFEPLAKRCPCYRSISVEKLAPEVATSLLRARGVTGPEDGLRRLAADQGYHALTIDLMGGFIARFCGGDPLQLSPDPLGCASAELSTGSPLDPEADAVREQEERFARLACRYREALSRNNPAALALLERVSLFRMPVDAGTISRIFTGTGKDHVGGPLLSGLDRDGLENKLQLLVEMRLLEKVAGAYMAHPAVRDEFRRGLGEDGIRAGHQAAGLTLVASLGGAPGEGTRPSDPDTLDLLEEVIHHMLAAGRRRDAWEVYTRRLGSFPHLGGRLGVCGRGDRICRLFAAGRAARLSPRPQFMSENAQAVFLNEWALYLRHLGRLEEARACFRKNLKIRSRSEDPRRSIGLENYADLLLVQGRLELARRAGRRSQFVRRNHFFHSPSYNHAVALSGRTDQALQLYEQARQVNYSTLEFVGALFCPGKKPTSVILHGALGLYDALLHARVGRREEAIRFLRNILVREESLRMKCHLALAELLVQEGSGAEASEYLRSSRDWAVAHDDKEVLCCSSLTGSRLALAEACRMASPREKPDRDRWLSAARSQIKEGLHVARECGFGLHYIDLLNTGVRLALLDGDPGTAERHARTALFGADSSGIPGYETTTPMDRGTFPPSVQGMPALLAATHPACRYAWGEAEARQGWAEALLLRAAQSLGKSRFETRKGSSLPPPVQVCVDEAQRQLATCVELCDRLKASGLAEAQRLLSDLQRGLLTTHPLIPPAQGTTTPPTTEPLDETPTRQMATPPDPQQRLTARPLSANVTPTIGIITALEIEYAAVQALLPGGSEVTVPGEGAGRRYWSARVPGCDGRFHAVILAGMPAMGNNIAAVRATGLLGHFPTVRPVIMTGIAGGVPNPKKPEEHVRLGDIVISGERGVVQYDMVKESAKVTENRASPRPPSAELLEAVRLLKVGELRRERPWEKHLTAVLKVLRWKRPPASSDVLFATDATDKAIEHPPDPGRRAKKPRVFRGPIASANVLLKNPVRRDALCEHFGIKAVEMEGSGIADATWTLERGYLVVRGICDYCDSNKGDAWQQYAAAAAAAYTRALLESMPGTLSPDQE